MKSYKIREKVINTVDKDKLLLKLYKVLKKSE